MTFADRLARFNRRLPNRVVRTVAGRRFSPVAVVVHRGRRSGRQYRTPVMPFPLDAPGIVTETRIIRKDEDQTRTTPIDEIETTTQPPQPSE